MTDPRPSLRPGLAAAPADDPRVVVVWDQLRISPYTLQIPRRLFACMERMDGQRPLRDLPAAAGVDAPTDALHDLLRHLDEAMFLAGPRFEAALANPVREPACIGCYSGEPSELRDQLRRSFTMKGGPGLPDGPKAGGRLRAALLPHIDYARGGPAYPFGFKEIIERSDASLFVIVATSHFSAERFTLTRKHFKTPLGIVPTDREYIDRLVEQYGDGLFDDPFAHYPEHSIELEVVYLQYLYENVRPIRIVPLVVGSFRDCIASGAEPKQQDDIRRMIAALQLAESATREPVCYVISGDFAHIGPKFDDPAPVAEPLLSHSRAQDHVLMKHAEAIDSTGYFKLIAAEDDARRICGLPPTYLTLEAAQPSAGRLLSYGQYVHPAGYESVSFASMAFDR